MRAAGPILVGPLFAPLHEQLIETLSALTPGDWDAPTAAGAWTVRDVAAHLLDTGLRRLSMHRDGSEPRLAADAFAGGLAAFVNAMNRDGVAVFARLSTRVLIDMHQRYGAELAEFLASLDPSAPAKWSVSWAGEETSAMWFDTARELTERWHHQQQIRDAIGLEPLYAPYLQPVLDTFLRALPFTYREANLPGPLVVSIDGATWSLVDGLLYEGEADAAVTKVTLSGDKAWRLFTRQSVDPDAVIEGEPRFAEPLLRMVAVV